MRFTLRVSVPQIAADQATDRHRNSVSPGDLAVDHEHDHCHGPEAPREQILEGYNAVYVSHPQQTEGTDHQDADSGPEVATVDGHNKHNHRRKRPQSRREAAVLVGASATTR